MSTETGEQIRLPELLEHFDEFLSSYFFFGQGWREHGRVIYEPPSPGVMTSERRRDEAKLGCSLGLGVLRFLRPQGLR